jgi:predicted MFS family arabinose efflux permease
LPLVARRQIAGGPEIYGVLLAAIGVGVVGGAFALPRLKAALYPDWLVAVGTIGTAGAMPLFGLAHNVFLGLLASLIAGVSWITLLSSLNISTQVALPEWVRGRGLSMFVTVLSAGLTIGSAIWGQVASIAGFRLAHFIAAGGAMIAIPLTWRWKRSCYDRAVLLRQGRQSMEPSATTPRGETRGENVMPAKLFIKSSFNCVQSSTS